MTQLTMQGNNFFFKKRIFFNDLKKVKMKKFNNLKNRKIDHLLFNISSKYFFIDHPQEL